MRRPKSIRALAQHGRELVLARYDWDVLAAKLEQAWKNVSANRTGTGMHVVQLMASPFSVVPSGKWSAWPWLCRSTIAPLS